MTPARISSRLLISIHALLAESDVMHALELADLMISIHALLAESDYQDKVSLPPAIKFLSTLSLRRATNINSSVNTADQISIHALLAESDNTSIAGRITSNDFYPRSPCGERLGRITSVSSGSNFYPRSPCGERRRNKTNCTQYRGISIHALLAESDNQPATMHTWQKVFLSTLSLRRATYGT